MRSLPQPSRVAAIMRGPSTPHLPPARTWMRTGPATPHRQPLHLFSSLPSSPFTLTPELAHELHFSTTGALRCMPAAARDAGGKAEAGGNRDITDDDH